MSRGSAASVFLGVDVGTGSARAGLFDENGKLLGSASSPIQIWKEKDCIEFDKNRMLLAVAVDADGSPVSVSLSGDTRRNIIVWMDHRAVNQAERINATNSPVLQYCGGGVSPEMQAPKLLWMKENLLDSWSMWKESDSRDMEACGWDNVFWEEIGLGDLLEGNCAKIGRSVAFPGHALGSGLTPTAAKASNFLVFSIFEVELGLLPGTPVGTSLIDAHAGGVGVMESIPDAGSKAGSMIPEFWLTEGGQSATGALLDYIIENHVASPLLSNHAASQRVIYGLTLDTSEKHLALLYLATIQGIAYGTRHIVEHCNAHGHKIDTLLACGGLAKNSLYIQEHADITGCPIILPRESESVLLGAAVLGAVAGKKFPGVRDAMKALNAAGKVVNPSSDPKVKKYHDAKYQIFRSLYEQQLSHRATMAQALQ
ncbi:FGGY family of carbohydrate kinase [Zea mays]|uniref:FGGY family of carbohydrate kinase n=1 Tax=Zea mays TaxID=4577 RepID=A0A1D6DWZ1_MAIZE|nr:FGGY family of carbohydrate kinase [Zea mays]